ncbi:hypothetical protein [Kitasatospora sp. MAP5-34]|nr:hypothetical protein [Kitasatospora sp. MAP5-34]MDH6580541.1 hypothetical protein [Kitasatospora sp. MAP5-34]
MSQNRRAKARRRPVRYEQERVEGLRRAGRADGAEQAALVTCPASEAGVS